MKTIKLLGGQICLVDDEDFDVLWRYNWYINNGYARRSIGQGKHEYMHKGLMQPPLGLDVDHIDNNKLNNQKANLRLVPRKDNAQKRKLKNNTSGLIGVDWMNRLKPWRARITVAGKLKHLGLFDSPEEAAKAYDKAAHTEYGIHAQLNYPHDSNL